MSTTPPPDDTTRHLLDSARAGDARALGELYARLYAELRRIAHARLRHATPATLNTTALVHESYERLAGVAGLPVSDKAHFLAYAARAMRSVVVDLARERLAERHGGGADHIVLDTALGERLSPQTPEVLRVHEALEELESIEARLAQVVELRYFAGLTHEEIAHALGLSVRTVERDWERARSYLYAVLKQG